MANAPPALSGANGRQMFAERRSSAAAGVNRGERAPRALGGAPVLRETSGGMRRTHALGVYPRYASGACVSRSQPFERHASLPAPRQAGLSTGPTTDRCGRHGTTAILVQRVRYATSVSRPSAAPASLRARSRRSAPGAPKFRSSAGLGGTRKGDCLRPSSSRHRPLSRSPDMRLRAPAPCP